MSTIKIADTRNILRIAVTGHWSLGDAATVAFVRQAIESLLRQFQSDNPQGVVALSGLALGADTIFAEEALALGIPLDSCIANQAVLEKYAIGYERDHHLELRMRSRRLVELPFGERSAESYLALGHWLVDSCDVLVAVWNGEAPAKPGGTGDVVTMAQQAGRQIIHIHPVERTIRALGRHTMS
jgi:hypothetical protein